MSTVVITFPEVNVVQVTVQKIGNSRGIRIPKKILEDTNLKEHDTVELVKMDRGIFIKKVVPIYKNLDEVFEGYDGSNKCEEWDFGEDVGAEKVW